MEDKNVILAPESAENAEVAAENTTEETVAHVKEPEKVYTEAEFNEKLNEVLGKKLARNTAKIRKEYEKKYGELESVLRAGTGKKDVSEVTKSFKDYYESKGIQIPAVAEYSDRDIEVLAEAEAKDIINSGLDDVIEETERLAGIGVSNMNAREKSVFRKLAEYRKTAEQAKELSKLGVSEDVYDSKEFKDFAGQFNADTPISKIYEIFEKTKPQKEIKTMGSMKNSIPDSNGVKDFYTRDEALQFTKKDFDKNPALFKAVEQSMLKW